MATATTRNHRLHTLGALGLTFTGLAWQIIELAAANPESTVAGLPPLLMVSGIIWFGVTRFRIWRQGR